MNKLGPVTLKKKTEVISYPDIKKIILDTKDSRTQALLAFQYAMAARAGELAKSYVHFRKKYALVDGKYVLQDKKKIFRTRGCLLRSFRIISKGVYSGIYWEAPNFKNKRNPVKMPYVLFKTDPWLCKILFKWVKHKKKQKKRFLFKLHKSRIRFLIDSRLKEYNREYSSHVLRHSRGTHLGIVTGNLFVVKDVLGHSRVDTSQQYVHVSRKELLSNLKGKSFDDILGKEF